MGEAVRLVRRLMTVMVLAFIGTASVPVAHAETGSAAALRASYERSRLQLEHSPFGQPLLLVSTQSADRLEGNIHAVVEHPFERVRSGLGDMRHWCDLLILHPNITNCRLGGDDGLTVFVGKNGTPLAFSYRVPTSTTDYLHVELTGDEGPAGTRDYRISVEATPIDEGHTIVRLVYSHAFGLRARLAMRAYLSTFGRGKVGFTIVNHTPEGKPVYIGDLRGALERNAMRYYMCIEAYLESMTVPPAQRLERRLQAWYAYTERYPLQLREEDGYLEAKRRMARSLS